MGVCILAQKPLEGKSRWCEHTYDMRFKSVGPQVWKRQMSGLQVEIIAGDQEF
jgi:hypothetical protein